MEPPATLRVACVSYLNTTPLIGGLEKVAGLTLVPSVPSRIAAMVRAGDVDLGLCSIVDAVNTAEDPLSLIPVGMIGCDGPTLTVRLFSVLPFTQVRETHADTDSHTSVVLCRLLLRRLYAAAPRVVPLHSTPPRTAPPALLLIGDKVVTAAPPNSLYPHQLDLGEAWKRLTGLPFVYATWMCRAERASDPAIRVAAALLDRQRRRNTARLGWLIERQAGPHGWPHDLAREYLGGLLRFELGPRERDAAETFLRMAAEDGLVPDSPPRWSSGLSGWNEPGEPSPSLVAPGAGDAGH